jgi:hypothetical protein
VRGRKPPFTTSGFAASTRDFRPAYRGCMSEAEIDGHEVVEPCPDCDALIRGVPGQTVVNGRLAWSISFACDRCSFRTEECGWDELPHGLRQLLLARDGTARLRLKSEIGAAPRLPILRVLRQDGTSLTEATTYYARLTGAGLTGTTAEMQLLADRLHAIGAGTQLDIE